MRPLILQFQEKPILRNESLESNLKYCDLKNLTVFKETDTPAVVEAALETSTVTRTVGEETDTDYGKRSSLRFSLDTSTATLVNSEVSDTDSELQNRVKALLETNTITESIEDTDSDPIR